MKEKNGSLILIIAGGIFVILFTLVAVHIKQNEPIDPSETNMIVLDVPGASLDEYGETRIVEDESYEDRSYRIRKEALDGRIMLTKMCMPNEQGDDEDMEQYMKRFVSESVYEGSKVTELVFNEEISEKLTYPAYEVCFEAGSGEDYVKGKGIVFLGDAFDFYYGFSCPADDYEDNLPEFDSRLAEVTLIDIDLEE